MIVESFATQSLSGLLSHFPQKKRIVILSKTQVSQTPSGILPFPALSLAWLGLLLCPMSSIVAFPGIVLMPLL